MQGIRFETKLFTSSQNPCKCVSKASLKRWIQILIEMAGIDVTFCSAHSTRAASTSRILKAGVPLTTRLYTGRCMLFCLKAAPLLGFTKKI